jgi:diacylglycerol kinase family enzyme
MTPFLLVNPRSGSAERQLEELLTGAERRGLTTHVLREGDDAAALARDSDSTAIGMAGGDGSLGAVAEVAIERDRPFFCVPFGTRNHFARDAGLPDDPIAALAAVEGVERRIDVGRVNGRVFLNNLSLGVYAHLVHRREHGRRRREALARLRALAIALHRPKPVRLDGRDVPVLLVANNEYRLDFVSVGERKRLGEGRLHVYVVERLLPWRWQERSGAQFNLDVEPSPVAAAIDGEPAELTSPLEVRVDPGALRLLQPRG